MMSIINCVSQKTESCIGVLEMSDKGDTQRKKLEVDSVGRTKWTRTSVQYEDIAQDTNRLRAIVNETKNSLCFEVT